MKINQAALAFIFFCCAVIYSIDSFSQAMQIYVSKQTGQTSSFSGSKSKTTDQYEQGTVTIKKTGPISYTVTPNDFSIGPNQTKTWKGLVQADVANIPEPGTSVPASITGYYYVTFSKPVQGQ